jgi:hypothetical protein
VEWLFIKFSALITIFNIAPKVLDNKASKIKGTHIGHEETKLSLFIKDCSYRKLYGI